MVYKRIKLLPQLKWKLSSNNVAAFNRFCQFSFRSYKGDKLITSEDERIEIIQDKDHPGFYELVIPEVKPEDAGEYRCVASNKYSDESCSCIVTVTSKFKYFTFVRRDRNIYQL